MPGFHMECHPQKLQPMTASANSEMCTSAELPDIVIPLPLHNPLPLQCLAAAALPDQVKQEIDTITDRYAETSVDSANKQSHVSTQSNEPTTATTCTEGRDIFALKRHFSNGYGLRIVGGVRCAGGERHAQVLCYNEDTVPEQLSLFKKDVVCVTSLNGISLQGATYEQVKKVFTALDKEVVELKVLNCRTLHVDPTSKSDCRTSPIRKKNHPTDLKGPRKRKIGVAAKPLVSTASSPQSPAGGFVSSPVVSAKSTALKNNTNKIQLSIRYYHHLKSLYICLHKVNGDAEQQGVFLNTYLIPDAKSLGTRYAVVTQSNISTSELLEKSACYAMSATELKSISLRVIVRDAKKSSLIGEVFLNLNDQSTVNLQGVPLWYTVSTPDPNLPKVPEPYYDQQQKQTFVNKMKSSWSIAQNMGQNTLRKITRERRKVVPKGSVNPRQFSLPHSISSLLDTLRDNENTSSEVSDNSSEQSSSIFDLLQSFEKMLNEDTDGDTPTSSQGSSPKRCPPQKRASQFSISTGTNSDCGSPCSSSICSSTISLSGVGKLVNDSDSASSVAPSSRLSLCPFYNDHRSNSLEQYDLEISMSQDSPCHQSYYHSRSNTMPKNFCPSSRGSVESNDKHLEAAASESDTSLTPTHNHCAIRSLDATCALPIEQEDDEEGESSLDFSMLRRLQLRQETQECSLSSEPTRTELADSDSRGFSHSCPARWNSIDNFLSLDEPSYAPKRKNWMTNITGRNNTKKKLTAAYQKGKLSGKITIQLTAKASSLAAKVLEIELPNSSKSDNRDISVKALLFNNSTDACNHKLKTTAILLNTNAVTPPSTFDFPVSAKDSSLQVVVSYNGRSFGRRSTSHVMCDLSNIFSDDEERAAVVCLQLHKLSLHL